MTPLVLAYPAAIGGILVLLLTDHLAARLRGSTRPDTDREMIWLIGGWIAVASTGVVLVVNGAHAPTGGALYLVELLALVATLLAIKLAADTITHLSVRADADNTA